MSASKGKAGSAKRKRPSVAYFYDQESEDSDIERRILQMIPARGWHVIATGKKPEDSWDGPVVCFALIECSCEDASPWQEIEPIVAVAGTASVTLARSPKWKLELEHCPDCAACDDRAFMRHQPPPTAHP